MSLAVKNYDLQIKMGRGVTWCAQKCENFASVQIALREGKKFLNLLAHPITGIYSSPFNASKNISFGICCCTPQSTQDAIQLNE